MITEDYVSFEVAKLLKEKGFNEKVICYYDDGGSLNLNKFVEFQCCNQGYGSSVFAAPTLQMVCKWLMEEKGIAIIPVLSNVLDNKKFLWDIKIVVAETGYKYYNGWAFENQEDAIDTAIKYSLENLI